MALPLKWENQPIYSKGAKPPSWSRLFRKIRNDNKVEYKVNSNHPLYNTLREVVLKHLD